MASDDRFSLFDIDLNAEITNPEFESEGAQAISAKEFCTHLPDLNIGLEGNFSLDLNIIPDSPETFRSQRPFDLNKEPHDNNVHVEEETNTDIAYDSYQGIDVNLGVDLEVIEPDSHPGIDVNLGVDLEVIEPDSHPEIPNASQENIEEAEPQSQRKRLKMLSNEERRAIYHDLLQRSVDGKLHKGVTNVVASSFSVSVRTIERIWKRAKESEMHDVSQRKTKNCGRKRIQIDDAQLREIPLCRRTTIRSLACALKSNSTSVFRLLKSGVIRRHSNAIKPLLKEENKRSRLEFCLSMLEGLLHDPMFKSMHNIIHIDEKWFYMTKKSENYYLLPDEDDPHRTCKSKNFIAKVMFLVALTRPRFDSQGNEVFSGKIGIFPFVTQEPAKRTSVNRVAGTMETKAITSVNREVIRSFLIEKVLPAIKEKWPREDLRSTIFIQQDNARTHINHDDHEFLQAATQDGFDIRLMCQPANSPDLNVLDLGFFRAIQSLQYKESPKTIDELVSAVVKSFDIFSSVKSNRIFLTLQLCLIEIMKAKGSNKYKIPHVNKERLEREGQLPTQMKCDPILVQEVLNYLNTG